MSDQNHSSSKNEPLSFQKRLYVIIFEADTRAGKLFDVALLYAISISILAVILESEASIAKHIGRELFYLEWILTVIFSIEYVLRVYASRNTFRYTTSFFGIVDFLATVPTYISLFVPGTQYLMVIRVLRLLRVFRVLKLARFTSASGVLAKALRESRHKILIFLGVVSSIVLILGTCMYIVESDQAGFASIPESMYWTVVTMTTVGYGDIIPQTIIGKFVASVMMLIGYAIIAVPTGIVSAELADSKKYGETPESCKRCDETLYKDANFCHKCGYQVKS